MIEKVVSGGSEHHHGRGAKRPGFADGADRASIYRMAAASKKVTALISGPSLPSQRDGVEG